jgi:hypothetical protein
MEVRPNSPRSRPPRVLRRPTAAVAPRADVRMSGIGDTMRTLFEEKVHGLQAERLYLSVGRTPYLNRTTEIMWSGA